MQNTTAATHPQRWWDLPAALLLLAALVTAALRLAATNWTEHLPLVQTLTILGFGAGLALGQSIFTRRTAFLLASAYGLFFVPWQLGLALVPNVAWPERIASLVGRLSFTINQLARQQPVSDSILFMVLMAGLFWSLSTYAGFTLTRRAHPWQATLPAGLALFIIHIYDPYWPYRTWYLAAYIFFSLLLLARLTFLQKFIAWKESNTRLPPYLGLDLIRATLMATAVLIMLAWTAPALASSVPLAKRTWDTVSRPWIEARSRMSNAFASLRASVGLINEYYGDTLPLGRGNQLSDQLVFTVDAPVRPIAGVRYYWRTRVYDTYDGGWSTNLEETQTLTPQQFDLNFPATEGRWEATFNFTTWVAIATLQTVPQPQWISRPVNADISPNADGTVDLLAVHAVDYVRPGETYEVRSSVTAVTINELRAAGSDYPAAITERYLQLPDTITPRTRELARQLTESHETPYDKVIAVTQYLRDALSYSETIPAWPSGVEPIDWVLFEHRQAFCNYYATAEIVLLRSIGIPARMAVGYAQGDRDIESNLFEVRQRDLHAWPEVFFPGIGWVEFEPTLNQLPIQRPTGTDPNSAVDDPAETLAANDALNSSSASRDELLAPEDETLEVAGGIFGQGTSIILPILVASLALGLIGAVVISWRKRRRQNTVPPLPVLIETGFQRVGVKPPGLLRRWAFFASLSQVERAYLELNRALSRIGARPHPNHTPAERAATLALKIPDLSNHTVKLLDEYHALVYDRRGGDAEIARDSARAIRNLSWLAWLNRLISRWQEPRRQATYDLR